MTYVLGLTGSIGMGKSTTAGMFRDRGIPVWDADAAVHRLYAPGGAAGPAIGRLLPQALRADGSVNRDSLRAAIAADPTLLDRINAVVHPLVAADRASFLAAHPEGIVVLDIPLLYEAGGARLCDAVVVVSAPADEQRRRVLARGLTDKEFQLISSRQMPDAEKRRRADFVVQTLDMDTARNQVDDILDRIRRAIDARDRT